MTHISTARATSHYILLFSWIIVFNALPYFLGNSYGQELDYFSFQFEGEKRDCYIFLPSNYHENMPVVLNLHGYTDTAPWQMEYTEMNDVADTAGFIAVYPNAVFPGFNSGITSLNLPEVDDIGFIAKLIDILLVKYDIDLNRVYCCGFSNGADMTNTLAYAIGHRIAAAAPIAGVIAHKTASLYTPRDNFPMLMCHGTEDGSIPYGGGIPGEYSVEQTLNFWVHNNNCVLPADTLDLADKDTSDGCTVEKIIYEDSTGTEKVIFYKIIEGGHSWPGGIYSGGWSGNTNKDIHASVEIWNFVKNFSLSIEEYAYGKFLDVAAKYLNPSGDSLRVSAQLANPENHPITVLAKLQGLEHSFADSLELFDDGLHSDGAAGDNLYGAKKYLEGLEEDMYLLELFTHDLTVDTTHIFPFTEKMTSAGPVIVESYTTSRINETLIGLMDFTLKNMGSTKTIESVQATLVTSDTSVTDYAKNNTNFGDIAPGASVVIPTGYGITISGNPDTIVFVLEISSNGVVYWTENLEVGVLTGVVDETTSFPTRYALEQNYPNPFNPCTTLRYALPKTVKVNLTVYNLAGQKIVTLVDDVQVAGLYEREWQAGEFPSGIYMCKMRADEFIATRKLVLLK